jgi:hypothetical protein
LEDKNPAEVAEQKLIEHEVKMPEPYFMPPGKLEKTITFRTGQAAPPWINQGSCRRLDSIESIRDLVLFRGSKERTVAFCDQEKIGVILDDQVERAKDTAIYHFPKSQEVLDWMKLFEKCVPQKDFIEFLKNREPDEVEKAEELLAKISRLSIATVIVGDFNYDDRNNQEIMFKTKDGEGQVKIPQTILVEIPLIERSDHTVFIEINLELIKPGSDSERPRFKIECPKLKRYWREACDYEVERLKGYLPDYQILAGSM